MAQVFPEWTNRIPLYFIVTVFIGIIILIAFFWYYGSPQYTDVGYAPVQPLPYSHKMHAGDLKLDCFYCHTAVDRSAIANIPPTQTCMNCHTLVKAGSEKLVTLQNSWTTGESISWIKVHDLADYAYFNHSAHLTAGVGCESCHGNIAEMEVVELMEPLSMLWCLDCHRDPVHHIRSQDQLTIMGWTPPDNQQELAQAMIIKQEITPPLDCSGCHR